MYINITKENSSTIIGSYKQTKNGKRKKSPRLLTWSQDDHKSYYAIELSPVYILILRLINIYYNLVRI